MRQISYDELKIIAKNVAKSISTKGGTYRLVAVARGGLTFAQLVSYYLSKPLEFFIPAYSEMTGSDYWEMYTHFIFLEDVIAEGRTFRIIDDYVTRQGLPSWEMIPVVLDSNAPADIQDRVNTYGMKTSDWIVFPHEDVAHTVEGDRGLFRAGTSANSNPII
jgi:hypoxanthine phosphoribosyltransferase